MAKITARKATVRKQGARGVFTTTVYKPIINGVTQQVGLSSESEAIEWGEKRAARLGI